MVIKETPAALAGSSKRASTRLHDMDWQNLA